MTVERITLGAFQQILRGKVKDPTPCVIKIYSNGCHFCQGLREHYEEMADLFDDYYFFAFNVEDHPAIEQDITITGVPTIAFVQTSNRGTGVTVLEDPPFPHHMSYYTLEQLKNFLDSLSPEEIKEDEY
tara:strand:+ start:414 stop:800 length:387 start_codon:yes stop_codon:yes gene_type:complete